MIQFSIEKTVIIQVINSIGNSFNFSQELLELKIDLTAVKNRLFYQVEKLRNLGWCFQKLMTFLAEFNLKASKLSAMQLMQAFDQAYFYNWDLEVDHRKKVDILSIPVHF